MNAKADSCRRRRIAKRTLVATALTLLACSLVNPFAGALAWGSTKTVGIEMLATQSVVPGQSAHFPFVLNIGERPVMFSISGLAAGVEAEMIPGGDDLYELLLHTSVDSPRGYFMVLIRARTSDGVVSKSVCLEIAAERDGPSTGPRVTQTAQLWRCGRRQPR